MKKRLGKEEFERIKSIKQQEKRKVGKSLPCTYHDTDPLNNLGIPFPDPIMDMMMFLLIKKRRK